ncbi:HEAT STRESS TRANSCRIPTION FACTOR A-8 [Salix koriyanagi]|uniref:HEAT STRESS TRANSCRIPTION FACTOR A-8 n=1 Tax=Salix koriyanagi TaxID=2511006 RepID=A0A9Q0WRF7_9ROSI|nr:HEAT STRESS TRANSCRIPTION FACTOR A-8 [Salix koriyanagi]
MVKSSESGVAPFLKKCYEMVDDESTNSIISWSQTNDSFVIRDMTEFSVHLLPKYFKHSNSSSFVRQLNIYGFRKIDTDQWEFANDGFIRGQKHLLKNIWRRKNSQVTDNRKSVQQQDNSIEHCESVENAGLWKEVENLKTGKSALTQELVKLGQHQETADNKLLLLRDRLQGMEKNQQQMLSFLVMVVQSPGFLAQLLHKKENNWRMAEPGSIVEQGADDVDLLASEGMIVRYQPPVDEMLEPVHAAPIGPENPRESNPSSDGMKDFFVNPDFMELLMDENLGSENHASFVLPELADDGSWEHMFLANPFIENTKDTKPESEESPDTETDTGTTVAGTQLERSQNFEYLIEQMEKFSDLENKAADGPYFDKSQNLEILTWQMDLLASEPNH